LPAIQYRTMTESFPYSILTKEELIGKMNELAAFSIPFLFIINYKADGGYVIPLDELDPDYIQYQFEYNPPISLTRNAEL